MARQRTSDKQVKEIRIYFPLNGLSKVLSYGEQPPITSPLMMNVRLTDVAEERARGGQRPGLDKAYSTQVVGSHPIIKITSIAHTYMSPA